MTRELNSQPLVLQTVPAGRRQAAGQRVEEGPAQTEQVRARTEPGLGAVHLWSRVADVQNSRVVHGPARVERSRRAEVHQHHAPITGQHDVGGFDVPMQQLVPMHLD